MLDPQEATIDFKKYLRKLQYIIERESSFTLLRTKIVDKRKIDDILCCIEASFPDDYKKFIKTRNLKSYNHYLRLLSTIRNPFWLSTSFYSVRYTKATPLITCLINSIDSDFRFVYNDQSGMF